MKKYFVDKLVNPVRGGKCTCWFHDLQNHVKGKRSIEKV